MKAKLQFLENKTESLPFITRAEKEPRHWTLPSVGAEESGHLFEAVGVQIRSVLNQETQKPWKTRGITVSEIISNKEILS